jgi:hypothetical protein
MSASLAERQMEFVADAALSLLLCTLAPLRLFRELNAKAQSSTGAKQQSR